MDAAIAAVLRQAAAAIGEPDRAAHVERVACEARGDLAYLSGDDSDDSDADDWEYAACPDAEQRFEAVESALAYRYASSRSQDADLDAVAHFAARAAVACGAVGHRGAAARAFLDKEVDRYRRRLHAGATRLAAVDAARARPGERQDDPDLEAPEHVAAYLRPSGAGAIVARRATPAFLNDMTGDRRGVVVFRRVAFFLADGAACRGIAVRRFRRKLAAALRGGALQPAEAVVGISDDPAVAAAERLVRWASAVAAAHRPGATLAIPCIGDVDDAVAKRRVAPCFVRMHNQLRHRKHLKHFARFQYRCLLSALGAPVDIAIAFGKERWVHWPSRQNEFSYGVRHSYGLEGQRVVYSPTGCDKMIKGDPTGKGAEGGCHDCPFVYAADVAGLLKGAYGLADGDVSAILAEAGPRRQCLATFRAVHGADAYDVASLERRLRKARVDASAKEVAGLERELAALRHKTFECPTNWTDRSLAVREPDDAEEGFDGDDAHDYEDPRDEAPDSEDLLATVS